MLARSVKSVLLAVVLTLAATAPARATVIYAITGAFTGDMDQAATHSFNISLPGTYQATLSDLLNPAIKGLELVVTATGGPTALVDIVFGVTSNPQNFLVSATSTGSYTAVVFGHPNARPTTGIFGGTYGIKIETDPPAAATTSVPEPGIWLMMLGGIGLLGWMRLRKSESFS
jgi:hypothetical protein